MFAKIKSWCLFFSTLGPLGEWQGAAYYATACAVPALYIIKAISWMTPGLFLFFYLLLSAVVAIVLHFGLIAAPDNDRQTFVLGTAFLFTAAFLGISVNVKMMVVGYLFYHLFIAVAPPWFEKTLSCRIQDLPHLAALLVPDLCAAALVNIMLRFILWVAH
jgi:ABC-type long-subunit fatty acid transport system fused permease/ATPase subunit